MARNQEKSNSLKELGYTLHPASGKDERGNEWVYRVKGTAPEYFIKKTKRGRLVAFKSKDAKIESPIAGLFNFSEKDGDLIGQRYSSDTGPELVKKTA